MGIQDNDFAARIKRVQHQSSHNASMPGKRRVGAASSDKKAMGGAILLPQLAFVLGAVALVAGRGIAMNYLALEPSTDLIGFGEGLVVVVLLVAIGLLFGKSNLMSHGALVLGASLAFLGESYYIVIAPELMESIYSPHYVGLVQLNFR